MSSKAKRRRPKRRQQAAAPAGRHTPGQTRAAAEMRELPNRHPLVLAAKHLEAGKGEYGALLRLSTQTLDRVGSGLPISPNSEEFELWFGRDYPDKPPSVVVRHKRFLGYPHVLAQCVRFPDVFFCSICIYLDVAREWHPAFGLDRVVARLVEWLEDAAADRFDSRTALYHPIGGLPPSPRVAGTLIVRPSTPAPPRKPISLATIESRAPHRSDLVRWAKRSGDDPASTTSALVVRTKEPMVLGLGRTSTLGDLLARVEAAKGPPVVAVLGAVERLLPHLTDGTLRIIVEVAHPAVESLTYVACAMAPVPRIATQRATIASHLHNLPIGWITVSDERTEIATRRDHQRPTSAYTDKTIEIWGCGGLGSWMAEFIARAGARRFVLRDTGAVAGGLLVRQNYTEDDVGLPKATQLAMRLRAISDDLEVSAEPSSALDVLADGYVPTTDILIDATINVTVGARLDEWARAASGRPLIAQVATDPRSATLGILAVADPAAPFGPATIDDATWLAVHTDPTLERFHGFWTPPRKTDQLVPALGCSTPTFHGSAADLACLAGSLVSLLAGHLGSSAPGTHLIEASHARGPDGGGHYFIPYKAT
ncbi:MAG: ThiF family adenylyltransferase [Acidimicrobiia bacterium]|nr:ThiF family adenylyltransferase [Acidimicrobiia bacterium]